jgi:3-phenylpropionate/trans-cinnamate dioxygenase ferredoxin subunit
LAANDVTGDYVRVMALAELAEGRMRSCRVADRDIVLCRVQGQVYALDNVCTHAFARMSEGRLRGVRLICPLHGASFDCRNGNVLGAPATKPLPVHSVRITDDAVEVALDPNAPPQNP